ncbi:hypothetical protein MBLNU459_g6433t1 [Dothideomycetes sp. NU459]
MSSSTLKLHGTQGGERLPKSHHDASCFLEKIKPVADEENQMPASASGQRQKRSRKLMIWMTINIVATIAIVFINKYIFDDPSFRNAQLSFAAFHFFITFGTLHLVSLPRIAFFERRRARVLDALPLAAAMCLNVVLPNLSLAYSSVTFYQTVRVLLTPMVAIINYYLYKTAIPRQAAYTLVPVCIGVAMVTYYDVKPGANVTNTSSLGVFFAMSGVLASSIYTLWISYFHKKLEMTSVQLLHNQSLIGAICCMYFVPFVDTLPVLKEVSVGQWTALFLSGVCACLINLSQFVIIAGAGPVASTVVGHAKTLAIVTIGWTVSRRPVSDKSIVGVVVAIVGIMLYSWAMNVYKERMSLS